jgi:hypothetical protein
LSATLPAEQVRRAQLWRAAWLLVAGRLEEGAPPPLPEGTGERAVFACFVARATAAAGGRRKGVLPALVACASWMQLGVPAAAGLAGVFADNVREWRADNLDDDAILGRLRLMLQRSDG